MSKLGKAYHNMTSRYNGYFNADILLTESIAALNESYAEDYDTLLAVFPYVANPNAENQYANLDKIIEKVTTISALHPVSHWLDDNYLMLGKANYLKKDYKSASNAFLYLINNFDPISLEEETIEKAGRDESSAKEKISRAAYKEQQKKVKERNKEIAQRQKERKKSTKNRNKKKKKRPAKEEETTPDPIDPAEPLKDLDEVKVSKSDQLLANANHAPLPMNGSWDIPEESTADSYFMKHRPAYQEGLLWQARAWTALENYFSAEHRLTQLIKDPKTFPLVRNDAIIALIDNYIKNNQFSHALTGIDHALERNIDREQKIRLAFIAGQIQSRGSGSHDAIPYFEKVRSLKPNYHLDFYAQLNIILIEDINVIEKLEKLLKNENNIDFGGEIYYQMAKVYFKNYEIEKAIETLKKVSSPELNASQKTKTNAYLTIAEYYFENEDYLPSKKYYDSTLMVMAQQDHRFYKTEQLAKKLKTVAQSIETIALQDSLLKISYYDYEQKKALALSLKKEDIEEMRSNEDSGNYADQIQSTSQLSAGGNAESSFFAYNEKELKRGERAFEKIWGDRKLADNWRNSSIGSGIGGSSDEIEDSPEADGRSFSFGITDTEIDEILKDVPKDDNERVQVKGMINEAMLKMAFSYRSDLNLLEKSNETLLLLLDRQPLREIEAEAIYLLYLNEKDLGHTAKADEYKRKFDQLFADTELAKNIRIANTPVFDQETVAESAYKKILKAYENDDLEEARTLIDQAFNMFKTDKEFMPKYALLDALVTGRVEGKEPYIEKLKYLVANYPNSDEGQEARNYIQVLGGKIETNITRLTNNDFNTSVASIPHYILVTVPSPESINTLKIQISDFNKEYFNNDKLTISTVQITKKGEKEAALLVRRFDNQEKAETYYNTVKKQENKFSKGMEVDIYPLAINNYRFLITEDRLDSYRDFIRDNYNLEN
ncbi:hypothetical protein GCM10025777_01530 [Membranihabitans marinus]